jgi:uncharacterized integral membrane protein
MKFLNEELQRKHQERKNDKASYWTNWIVKIILLLFALLIIRHFSDLHILFFDDIFRSSRATEEVENNPASLLD